MDKNKDALFISTIQELSIAPLTHHKVTKITYFHVIQEADPTLNFSS